MSGRFEATSLAISAKAMSVAAVSRAFADTAAFDALCAGRGFTTLTLAGNTGVLVGKPLADFTRDDGSPLEGALADTVTVVVNGAATSETVARL